MKRANVLGLFKSKAFYVPLTLFLVSRLFIILVSVLNDSSFGSLSEYFLYRQNPEDPPKFVSAYPQNAFIDNMARWDGGQFLYISSEGYVIEDREYPNTAFFPVYPLLLRYIAAVVPVDVAVLAVGVSHLFFLLSLYLLYFFVREFWGGEERASQALLFLVAFPAAFFFSATYSESLYLFLSVLCFFALEKKMWWLAGITGAFASGTRLVGIALFPVGLFFWAEYFVLQSKFGLKNWKPMVLGLVSVLTMPLGLAAFMFYLGKTFGDPWSFFHVQERWGSNHMNILHTIQDMWWVLAQASSSNRTAMMVGSLFAALFCTYCIWVVYQKMNYKYAFYSLILFILPFGTRAESLARYVSIIFPLFIGLAMVLKSEGLKQFYLSLCIVLQVCFLLLFIHQLSFF